MQVIKPTTMTPMHITYDFNGDKFSVGALSFFKLGADNEYLQENIQWGRIRPYLDKGLVLDTGHAKGVGEVLIAGKAYSPDGKPTKKMDVSVKVGKLKKKIQVIGSRTWCGKSFAGFSDATKPDDFTEMPLGFEQAYGGEGFTSNPKGKGVVDKANKDKALDAFHLPNLYTEKEKTTADGNKRSVACFLPLDITHPQRAQYTGSFTKKWLDQVHPGFPTDANALLFNVAPLDQQIKGFFKPGQAFSLNGMHPEMPELKGKIPDSYVRLFVTQKTDGRVDNNDEGVFKEIPTHIDTIWFFPDLELGIAIHRGMIPANDSAGLDIKNLMLALENVDDEPRPTSYYQEVRDLRLNQETSAGHLFNASQLLPALKASELAEREQLFAKASDEQNQKADKLAGIVIKQLKAEQPDIDWDAAWKNAKAANAEDQKDGPAPIPQELIDKGDFDLTPLIEWSKKQWQQAEDKTKQKQTEMQDLLAKNPVKPPPSESESDILARINAVVRPDLMNPDIQETVAQYNDPNQAETQNPEEKLAFAEGLNQQSQRFARQTSPGVMDIKMVSSAASQLIRQKVIELIENGESLVGRDLAGADLSGLNLAGLDFSDVMLERANLTGSNFTNCVFDGAVLVEALVDNALLEACSFVKANLSNVKASQSRFNCSNFTQTLMTQSQFSQCDFSGSKFSDVQTTQSDWEQCLLMQAEFSKNQWVECKLNHTCWQQSKLNECTWLQCEFQQSDWQQSILFRCILVKSTGQNANFCGVSAQRVQFSTEGDFQEAEFSAGNWEYCGFRGLNLTGADLSASVFKSCDFGDANLTGARLSGTLFHSSLVFRANLKQSDCTEAVFFQSNLRKSEFIEANLQSAQLTQSNLREVVMKDCKTQNLQQSPLPSIK